MKLIQFCYKKIYATFSIWQRSSVESLSRCMYEIILQSHKGALERR